VSVATNALRLRGFKWPDSALQVVETSEAATSCELVEVIGDRAY